MTTPGGRSYEPALERAAHWRQLATLGDDDSLRALILDMSTEFARKHSLDTLSPRHDVMDHLLPLRDPLGITHEEEILADVVKLAAMNLMFEDSLDYPESFLVESVLARSEEYGYVHEPEFLSLRRLGACVWRSTIEFYQALGVAAMRRLWAMACRLHYDLRSLPYHDDYFAGRRWVFGDPDNIRRCG